MPSSDLHAANTAKTAGSRTNLASRSLLAKCSVELRTKALNTSTPPSQTMARVCSQLPCRGDVNDGADVIPSEAAICAGSELSASAPRWRGASEAAVVFWNGLCRSPLAQGMKDD